MTSIHETARQSMIQIKNDIWKTSKERGSSSLAKGFHNEKCEQNLTDWQGGSSAGNSEDQQIRVKRRRSFSYIKSISSAV